MSLADTHFWVIGAGGLGCPALLGLVCAGARRLTIVDPDRVETSNLQRQVLYDVGDVGAPKALAASRQLRGRAPLLEVDARVEAIAEGEVASLLFDLPHRAVVLECTDQPGLKFALNDAVMARGRVAVIGAALGLRAQVIALAPGHACYRCIYERPPAPERIPTCAMAGVLGPAVGLAGWLMASLAVALAEGRTETAGRLVAIDLSDTTMRTLAPTPRSDCSACALTTRISAAPVRSLAARPEP